VPDANAIGGSFGRDFAGIIERLGSGASPENEI
jgi:hypothetical protein